MLGPKKTPTPEGIGNRSIATKLVTYFLLLNIFTVIINVGSYSISGQGCPGKEDIRSLTSLRIEKKYRIEKLFEDRIADINLVSGLKMLAISLTWLSETIFLI
ncbi:MAG: hypothetical protein R2744_03280 [Bacteroidales bacterium]